LADSVRLQWVDVAALDTAYIVQRSLDGGQTFLEIAQLAADATTFTEQLSVSQMDSLVYRVAAINGRGISPYSNEVGVSTALNTAPDLQGRFRLYPNPTTGHLRLEFEPGWRYTVLDAQGKVLLSGRERTEIDTTAWPVGLYLVRFEKKGRTHSLRFLKE
ncbi:MAG: T9SS type A sorting domain-containing protein, partial [Bacteroidota bacterium]